MDILWHGQAFFRLKGKNVMIAIDPYDPEAIGLKLPKETQADAVLKTHDHKDHSNLSAITGEPIQITGPGEYEVKGAAITGIGVFHDNVNGAERGKNTIYNIEIDGLNIVHLGDLGHLLTESQIQELGTIDILLIPVGGVYTIDAKLASEVVAQLEPRIVIPMHYLLPGLKAELEPVDNFLKEMGKEGVEPVTKLAITKDKLPEEPQVVVLAKI